MKKKIYAVKKGRTIGIFTEWLEAYKQVRGYSGAQFKGFDYHDTLDPEDENRKGSLAYATALAKAYLGLSDAHDKPEEYEEQADERPRIKTIDASEFEDEIFGMEDNPYEQNSMQALVVKTSRMAAKIKESIKGQDAVIEKLEEAHFHAEKKCMMMEKNKKPKSVYLFAGPPGVGKTYLAEVFAESLGLPYLRLDMSGYPDKNSILELVGSSETYTKAKEGELTGFAMKNPKSVILFDEIEKAGKSIILLLLRLLDEGICHDHFHNQDISFQDSILIFTTNVGKQLYEGAEGENLTAYADRIVIDSLRKDINPETNAPYFPPEIVSRLGSHTILMFNHLSPEVLRTIMQADVEKQLEKTQEVYRMNLKEGSEYLVSTVQFSAGLCADARKASKLAGRIIDKEIYELVTVLDEKHKNAKLKSVTWSCDFTGASDAVKALYCGEKDAVIAVFGEAGISGGACFEAANIRIAVTTEREQFKKWISEENVLFAVVQYAYGRWESEEQLSIIDVPSDGKEVFSFLRKEYRKLPVYVLCEEDYCYSKSERDDLQQEGASGFLFTDSLTQSLEKAYQNICCKNAMHRLERQHQVLTFDTRNAYDAERQTGSVIFYNLKLETAIDSEDKFALLTKDMKPNKKWEDIWVSEDIKEELLFFIHYLQNPDSYKKQKVSVPKGVLMYGPPGTGKTSLAKVVATESDVNFIATTADVLLQNGAGYVSGLFRTARKYAPTVLFIDEIDAIGINRRRTGANATLNALLTEMDGFSKDEKAPVFVMAATNMGSEIDPALARRFDRRFCVDLPNKEGREWVLRRLLRAHQEMFEVSEEEIQNIAVRSSGMSPSALEHVVETALREAIRSNTKADDAILDEAFEKCIYGDAGEKKSEEEKRRVACHEAGHALIHMYYGKTPDYMTIVSRGNFGGYVLTAEDKRTRTKERMLEDICAALGGRAAEVEFGYGLTPGASADLEYANELAKRMICRYGMYEEEIGLIVIPEENLHHYPEAETLMKKILSEQLKEARHIICKKRKVMEGLMDAIISSEQNYLTKKELQDIYEQEKESAS